MLGFMLDSLFMDEVYSDLDRIRSFNRYATKRRIEPLMIQPSQDLTDVARRHAAELPRSLRALMRTMGASNTSGTHLLSYLLFERGFTRELIALGHRDAGARAEELRAFLGDAARLVATDYSA
jgi:NTE family protein